MTKLTERKITEISMEDINLTGILKKVPNRFMLCVAVAKRARQVKEGAKVLVPIDQEASVSSVLTALKEIGDEKISVVKKKDEVEESEMLEKMDEQLEKEILIDEQQEQEKNTKKKAAKESKSKTKSKSLAA